MRILIILLIFVITACSNVQQQEHSPKDTATSNHTDTVAETVKENKVDSFPEADALYFESNFRAYDEDGSMHRIRMHEHIQLWDYNGKIKGRGMGDEEGGEEWTFTFSGERTDDTIKVTVNYIHSEAKAFSASETWIMNADKESMKVQNPSPERPGAVYYANIGLEFFPVQRLEALRALK